eukprot:CAMPEP_0113847406 /NCGR_PEP_ID=MMETSP0372-20130328/1855_1 /TAXON_ID=340204 /ORGANISM="Lankesteria abbotti" /LENGTH=116 /DNA_ID=CAMNT_0000816677 /DNA_START=32 /DNA_END=382 /DNA_ORIENTATION=- /assembly_acc=CAM_ASM_000359
MKQAILLAYHAWEGVTKSTIVNCWRRCDTLECCHEGDKDEEDRAGCVVVIEECSEKLEVDMEFGEFVAVDNEFPTEALLSDNEIVKAANGEVLTPDVIDADEESGELNGIIESCEC